MTSPCQRALYGNPLKNIINWSKISICAPCLLMQFGDKGAWRRRDAAWEIRRTGTIAWKPCVIWQEFMDIERARIQAMFQGDKN